MFTEAEEVQPLEAANRCGIRPVHIQGHSQLKVLAEQIAFTLDLYRSFQKYCI